MFFCKSSFSDKKLNKKITKFFFTVYYFFQCSPYPYLQLCRRHQIDQKIPSKDTDFWIFIHHFCMDSCRICMENYMDKLMMQNGFFGHTEGTKKVSVGLKNTIKNRMTEILENCSISFVQPRNLYRKITEIVSFK